MWGNLQEGGYSLLCCDEKAHQVFCTSYSGSSAVVAGPVAVVGPVCVPH